MQPFRRDERLLVQGVVRRVLSAEAARARDAGPLRAAAARSSRSTTRSIGCPRPTLLGAWRSQVPESFRFAIKTPRRITHVKRLKDCSGDFSRAVGSARGAEAVPRARCSSSCRRSSKVDRDVLSSFVGSYRRAAAQRSSSATRRGSCPTSTTCCEPGTWRSSRARTTTASRRRRGPPTGRTCASARSTTPTRISTRGSPGCAPRRSSRPTCTSSTKMPATGPKLAAKFLERAG